MHKGDRCKGGGVLCLAIVLALSAGYSLSAYGEVEMTESRFSPCPNTPNCVSSKATDAGHYVDPLHYQGNRGEAWVRLITIINGMKRAEVIENTGTYIHATFTSWLFRFVDDVEFEIDEADKAIHMKSASRVGNSDLGVNRRRCETIRGKFSR